MPRRLFILPLIPFLAVFLLSEANVEAHPETHGISLPGKASPSWNRGCRVSRRAVPSHRGAGRASSVAPSNGAGPGSGWTDEESEVEFCWAEFLAPDMEVFPDQQSAVPLFLGSTKEVVVRRVPRPRLSGRKREPAIAALGDSLLLSRPPPASPLSA